jgi:hypothetical protein
MQPVTTTSPTTAPKWGVGAIIYLTFASLLQVLLLVGFASLILQGLLAALIAGVFLAPAASVVWMWRSRR